MWVSNVISHLPGAFVLSFARIISIKVLHLYELVQSVCVHGYLGAGTCKGLKSPFGDRCRTLRYLKLSYKKIIVNGLYLGT